MNFYAFSLHICKWQKKKQMAFFFFFQKKARFQAELLDTNLITLI